MKKRAIGLLLIGVFLAGPAFALTWQEEEAVDKALGILNRPWKINLLGLRTVNDLRLKAMVINGLQPYDQAPERTQQPPFFYGSPDAPGWPPVPGAGPGQKEPGFGFPRPEPARPEPTPPPAPTPPPSPSDPGKKPTKPEPGPYIPKPDLPVDPTPPPEPEPGKKIPPPLDPTPGKIPFTPGN